MKLSKKQADKIFRNKKIVCLMLIATRDLLGQENVGSITFINEFLAKNKDRKITDKDKYNCMQLIIANYFPDFTSNLSAKEIYEYFAYLPRSLSKLQKKGGGYSVGSIMNGGYSVGSIGGGYSVGSIMNGGYSVGSIFDFSHDRRGKIEKN